MDERLEAMKTQLAEEIDAASLLLDDRLYTHSSYFALVTAIGCAKVALAEENADAVSLESACAELHDAVDAMELRETAKEPKPAARKRNLTPLLLAGAFCGGLFLGSRLAKKRKNRKESGS